MGKELASVLFKVKNVNNSGDVLYFLKRSAERRQGSVSPGRDSRGTRDQIANIHWIIAKARELKKKKRKKENNPYFCFID